VLDVCATCHPNATCEDKPDGSGKVCNCNYGFVGNGRTHCQKDECQIGASKICGQQTTCHNTYGSYYCTCLSGYSPSNNMAVFIPNDGTHCQIDECRITGLCGEGGQCRNLEGSFDCSCQVGYRVHNGAEPFRPQGGGASCKVVDCGPPVPVEDSVLLSITVTTYGGVARFGCEEGFVWRRGDNSSVCGADGSWSEPSLVCEKCGPVPVLAHSEVVWHNRSVAIHRCAAGYHSWRGVNASVCGGSGLWLRATLNLVICLRLLPLTNYSISITAAAARFTATVTANTPVVHYTELETPVPTLRLKRSPNTLDPIFYQIFVLPVEELVVFDCSSPASLDPSSRVESPAEYMTAQLGVQSLGMEVNFTVGDGVLYGGFYNAPLQSGNTYFVVLRVVSRWKK
uniref:Sushi domain containing 1 n=1 Tax=Xiphophorus couchianus TaxID=32473 RepID=A0A3B5LLD3_9TELE